MSSSANSFFGFMPSPMYTAFDLAQAAMTPYRAAAAITSAIAKDPSNPFRDTPLAKYTAAGADLFERLTRHYPKPPFNIQPVKIGDCAVPIVEEVILDTPFCRLVRFRRDVDAITSSAGAASVDATRKQIENQPRCFLAAPLSGHYAALLRGTVTEMARHNDVYITDWKDASTVPLSKGAFSFDHYVQLMIDFITKVGPGAHVMAVCQPSVPVYCAVSLMNADNHPATPRSLVMMGGPLDTRINPQVPNEFAKTHSIDWFKTVMVHRVPFGHEGALRPVAWGAAQQVGFVSQQLARHTKAHLDLFWNLVEGRDAAVAKHDSFYDTFSAFMDMPGEYYEDTIKYQFIEHLLARGELVTCGRPIKEGMITKTAIGTIEGENDNITGTGQTEVAHQWTPALAASQRLHYVVPKAGHYGIFSGSSFEQQVVPRIVEFQLRNN